ncbi:hypothetical protein [Vibrio mediterranei]|uniref:hypothetical protein n=1 Tax=Vibrio mediterranei TaxID=689 RepID=UPI0040687087
MNKKQIHHQIREILPPELAVSFYEALPYLLALTLKQPHPRAIEKLNQITNTSNVSQDEYLAIYDKLSNCTVTQSEFSRRNCIVISERSLLNILNDGESHLQIYPEINFNSHFIACTSTNS